MATQTAANPLREKMMKGLSYQKSGEIEKAQRCYKQVLKKVPNNADALHLLGVTYRQLGYPKRAVEFIQKAIGANANQAPFYANLARAMMDIGTDPGSLLAVSEKALSLNPHEKEALNIKGIALTRLEQSEEAEAIFQRLIVAYPDFGDVYRNYGILLRQNKDYPKALVFFQKAIQLTPDNPQNYIERSRCRQELKDYDVSREELTEALRRFPKNADLKHEAARLLFSISQTHVGVTFAEEAVEDNPRDFHRLVTLAVHYLMLGRGHEAIETFLKAKKLAPEGAAGIDWNLSLSYLSTGDLINGWATHRARFADKMSSSQSREFSVPEWDGEDISDKTVLVWGDQGLGDALKCGTMLPDLSALARKIIVELSEKAVPLYKKSFPDMEFRIKRPDDTDAPVDYDVTANITDIARFLRTDLDQFRKAKSPAYSFDKDRARSFLARIPDADEKPIIGVAWRSKNLQKYRARYYLSAPDFAPVIEAVDAIYLNLQYMAIQKELDFLSAKANGRFTYFEDVDLFDDLCAAADLTAICDLVVSANTSVADMAGILGVPCVRFGPVEPPLLLGQSSPPWYPSMKYVYVDESKKTSEILPEIFGAMKRELDEVYPHSRLERLK
ncbi:tetratricopeptide repeat protein [uncultured Roseibium sp.]|uniref:tetratricopeptide repeat protein n=1 Tax=uncultured Roseibium sp. TaxID=1936171 RepID=UPI0026085E83|nr:tetratricopeptide repeat protein [uncultured Roseibium sp.]